MYDTAANLKAAPIVVITEPHEAVAVGQKIQAASVFTLADVERLTLAVDEDSSLKDKPWVVAVRSSTIPDSKRPWFWKLVALVPNMVCAFFDLDQVRQRFLYEMASKLRHPVPPFRVLNFFRSDDDDWECLQSVTSLAVELADPNSLLGRLTRAWGSWDSAASRLREGSRIWAFSDLHVDKEPLQGSPLQWLQNSIVDMPRAELPDTVLILGDTFNLGSCKVHVEKEKVVVSESVSAVSSILQTLHEKMEQSEIHRGNQVFVVAGEHDFSEEKGVAPKTLEDKGEPTKYLAEDYECWVRFAEQSGVVSAFGGGRTTHGDGIAIGKAGWEVLEEARLPVIHGEGKAIRLSRMFSQTAQPSSTSPYKTVSEALGVIRLRGGDLGLPLRLILLSSFDPVVDKPIYQKMLKAGTISGPAKLAFQTFLERALKEDATEVSLNCLCMHHPLRPLDMKLSTQGGAGEIRGVGAFDEALDVVKTPSGSGLLVLHGHTHVFHLSLTRQEENIIHIGVPRLGKSNAYEPRGFVGLSLVRLAGRDFALCVGQYQIQFDSRSSPCGSVFLPVRLWVLRISTDAKGFITGIDEKAALFQGGFSADLGAPFSGFVGSKRLKLLLGSFS